MFLALKFFWGSAPLIFGLALKNTRRFRPCGKVSGRSVEGTRRTRGEKIKKKERKKTSLAFYKSSRTTVTGGLITNTLGYSRLWQHCTITIAWGSKTECLRDEVLGKYDTISLEISEFGCYRRKRNSRWRNNNLSTILYIQAHTWAPVGFCLRERARG